MLKTFFLPALRRRRVHIKSIYFQQDGATSHVTNEVLMFLQQHFDKILISGRCDFTWRLRSPDLTPLDFFLWDHLKAKVYARQPSDIQELKTFVKEEIRGINKKILHNVVENFVK